MLDFAAQKKLLDPLLKHPRNHLCADCDSISPTWASLDFGVFLCGNCSGAHRALGPTITRVRSANLDKWQEEWVGNMQLGNEEINKYWEGRPSDRKPKMGASLDDIGRYVREKYVKKRFVLSPEATDPLTSYKNGTFHISKEEPQRQPQSQPNRQPPVELPVVKQPEPVTIKPKAEISLLDFDFDMSHQHPHPQQPVAIQQAVHAVPVVHAHEDEEFTDYAQVGSVSGESKEGVISFDALMNQHKQVPQQIQPHQYQSYSGLKTQNLAMHHPYNPTIAHHNLVYNAHFPQQQPLGHPMHGFSANQYQAPHNYSPMGHFPSTNHQLSYQQQYGYNQVGVGNYWK